jgi:trimeric autotransporter adhesin
MKHTTKLLVLVAAVIGALSMAGAGWAFWTTHGSGSASASVGTLNPPSGVTVNSPVGSSTVNVSWTAPTSGVTPSGYYVLRSGVPASPACGTASSTIATTSCSDTGVSNGTYTYTVTAVYNSWTALSAASGSITVSNGGPLDHFSVSAPATATAGITFSTVSVSALSVGGQPATGWASTTQCVTFSGPGNSPNNSSPNYPSVGGCTAGQSSLTFNSSGQATSLAFILKKAETTSLTVTAAGKTGQSSSIVVSDGGVDHLVVGASATATAGTPITGITLTARDLYDNTAKGYGTSQTITWTGPTNSPAPSTHAPTLPASTVAFSSGASTTALSATLYNATSNLLIATDVSGKTGSTTIAVSPADASTLVVSGFPSPTVAGVAHTFSVTAKDAFGNTATGYVGTVHVTSSDGQAVLPANNPFVAGDNGTHSGLSATLKTVGTTQAIIATDTVATSITGSQSGIVVVPAAAATLVFSTQPATSTAGSALAGPPAVTVTDAFGNTVSGQPVTLAKNSGPGAFTAGSTLTATSNGSGVASFSNLVFNTAGGYTLTATSAAVTVDSSAVTVNSASLAFFTVSNPGTQTAGTSFNVTATALDAFGNAANGWTSTTGCIVFSGPSNSPNATAPIYPVPGGSCSAGRSGLSFNPSGQATASITLFKASATTTLTVKDATTQTKTGTATIAVNSAGATLSFTTAVPTGKFLAGKDTTWSDTVSIGPDAYGNAALYAAPGLTLTVSIAGADASHFTLTTPSTGSYTTSGSPSPTFTVTHNDAAGKTATITISGPANVGFTPVSGTLSS